MISSPHPHLRIEKAAGLKLDIMLQAASQKKETPNGVPLQDLSELRAQL